MTCGTCNWWRRNKPGKPVRSHSCVQNHTGSARLMESVSGQIGVQELNSGGTHVEILEGDGDNTLISRLKTNLNLEMKKRFDKNHVVKNIGKHLRTLFMTKRLRTHQHSFSREKSQSRKRLSVLFPCKTRHGMSCAVDTAWEKRGFDTHTFFMSRAKYGKKVVKSVVCHRTCGTCYWWRRNKPGKPVRSHRCVQNHTGSARLMESVNGHIGVQELNSGGTPVEILEGDGDNTLISRLKTNLNLEMKKRFDKNHVVKNIGKHLRTLQSKKGLKLSVNAITHISKCVSYAFSKHQGDKVGLEDNLKAINPHNFGDHTLCQDRFCGYKRKPGEKYLHRSLSYKGPLKCDKLRERLATIMAPIIARSHQYSDLGSSQQCEHANRELPKVFPMENQKL
ncbi:hypothetical protein MAR_019066 [Mya arenaria]|uniref:Mutator-like transposase domain-containing protein n=1 Tax=Mya arenaria TaxID=6604 RepID=A0ABY7EGI5_MYAAR|nr:hypothetical protein MAR_019066 [Mya arenaria]